VASRDVAATLAAAATGDPQGIVTLAGPDPVDFVELVRRTFEAEGESVTIVPTFEGMPFGPDVPDGAFLAPAGATIGSTTLDQWLDQRRTASTSA
jgi:uncharacterized protein YbjT (DUF2867 family)